MDPRPLHVWQAPKGLLKENRRGATSERDTPQSEQAKCSLNSTSASLGASRVPRFWTMTRPSPFLRAVATLSARRDWISALTIRRSMTMATSCFFCLSRAMSSTRSRTSPSIRARTKPSLRAASSSFLNSPLRPRAMGASTWKRVPSGQASTWSTICSTVWGLMVWPHLWQWGVPTRANNRRR
ncbi:hypothetical protein D3C86_1645030 [compost metagenome]